METVEEVRETDFTATELDSPSGGESREVVVSENEEIKEVSDSVEETSSKLSKSSSKEKKKKEKNKKSKSRQNSQKITIQVGADSDSEESVYTATVESSSDESDGKKKKRRSKLKKKKSVQITESEEQISKRKQKKKSKAESDLMSSDEEPSSNRKKKLSRYDSEGNLRSRTKSKPIVLEHKRSVLGEIIYKGHPSWVLMQNIQTGIRYSVSKASELVNIEKFDPLRPKDFFKSPPVLYFPTEGSQQTPAHKTPPFKFKDYCPIAFRQLREKFEIDPSDYLISLCNTLDNGQNALLELPTPGKSGSLFLFSQDMKYILKTIPKREAKLLRKLLPEYFKHVMENGNTLLPKFFGLHRVKPTGGRQVRFVVMGNIFATHKKLHERYDLKGSTAGRQVSQEERVAFKENVTYKDIDWRNQGKKLYLGPKKDLFLEQLRKDCALLEKLNIMDYSLLVGIHRVETPEYTIRVKKKSKSKKEKKHKKKNKNVVDSSKATDTKEEEQVSSKQTDEQVSNKAELEENERDEVSDASSGEDDKNESDKGHNRYPSIVQTSYPLPQEYKSKMVSVFQQDDGGTRGLDKDGNPLNEYYYLGIIDILMLYSARKRVEHTYKTYKWKGVEISSVNPTSYSKRFQKFLGEITE